MTDECWPFKEGAPNVAFEEVFSKRVRYNMGKSDAVESAAGEGGF
jgi:hypothetical protein